jgi:TldD protein
VALLKAPKVAGGEYTVILDPVLAGVFIHEAFGHLSEADHIYAEPRLQELMAVGKKFGGPDLNVKDGATVPTPTLRGSYLYDDEGVQGQETDLIRDGILVGRLHSRETAAKLGERPTGNARALNYRFSPIVRMTNTFIVPGTASPDDLFADVEDGLYVKNWYGGMTSMEMFTFSAGEAYRIRNGRIEELLRPVMLSGNVFSTLHNIDGIANDLGMNEGGGCGKAGQGPLPVSNGSPHIRIRQCLIGGA